MKYLRSDARLSIHEKCSKYSMMGRITNYQILRSNKTDVMILKLRFCKAQTLVLKKFSGYVGLLGFDVINF